MILWLTTTVPEWNHVLQRESNFPLPEASLGLQYSTFVGLDTPPAAYTGHSKPTSALSLTGPNDKLGVGDLPGIGQKAWKKSVPTHSHTMLHPISEGVPDTPSAVPPGPQGTSCKHRWEKDRRQGRGAGPRGGWKPHPTTSQQCDFGQGAAPLCAARAWKHTS